MLQQLTNRIVWPTFAAIAIAGCLGSCIKNDLPYPRIQQNIIAISAEGETQPAQIDSAKFSVTLYLDETTDIKNVKITNYELTPGAVSDPELLGQDIDLSVPIVVNISRWQDYQWLIQADQHIERYLTVSGQIGQTVIDEIGHRIIITMPETANLSRCELTSVKLGPKGLTTMQPALTPGTIDLSRPVRVAVTCWGRTEDWTIYTEKTAQTVQTTQADAWSQVMWVYGNGPSELKGEFQYRKKGTETWTDADPAWISQTEGSGSFFCYIPHLTPLTSYEVRAKAGQYEGNIIELTTEGTEVLPDGSFDQWWLNRKIWCPWNEDGTQFWDTGNTGAATLGESNVTPTDDTPLGSGRAARLETKFVGLFGIGKLAAGSIYTGKFAKVDGTNGILDFGRPWTVRPTKLRGYYKYTTAPIDYVSKEWEKLKGQPDTCHIYIALTDWTAPYQIRTNPGNRQLFNPNAPEVIAYGTLERGSNTDGWQEFEITLKYKSTSRKPRYLQITNAASKYGDYFTGGTGACLLVDQYSLEYDY